MNIHVDRNNTNFPKYSICLIIFFSIYVYIKWYFFVDLSRSVCPQPKGWLPGRLNFRIIKWNVMKLSQIITEFDLLNLFFCVVGFIVVELWELKCVNFNVIVVLNNSFQIGKSQVMKLMSEITRIMETIEIYSLVIRCFWINSSKPLYSWTTIKKR